jgi:predicted transcriptional regulator
LKKNIKYTHLAEVLGLSRQTVSTRFKNLIQLGLIDDKNSDTYELVTLDNNVAWLIQSELL